jgi:hypothetical protein
MQNTYFVLSETEWVIGAVLPISTDLNTAGQLREFCEMFRRRSTQADSSRWVGVMYTSFVYASIQLYFVYYICVG